MTCCLVGELRECTRSFLPAGKVMTMIIRRCRAVEILRKMLSKDFLRRLKSSGFDERMYNQFRRAGAGDGDKVSLDAMP